MEKTNLGLVEHAEKWVGQVYWYGTYCQSCTESRLNAKKKQYPSHYTAGRMATYKQHIRSNKIARKFEQGGGECLAKPPSRTKKIIDSTRTQCEHIFVLSNLRA